jgi:hypothetical protein
MGTFIADTSRYNRQYLNNKTQTLQQVSRQMVKTIMHGAQGIPSISMQLEGLTNPIDKLRLCFASAGASGSNSGSLSEDCSITVLKELQDAYAAIRHDAQLNVNLAIAEMRTFQNEVQSFMSAVSTAIGKADDFFESVVGAAGILSWLVRRVDFLSGMFRALRDYLLALHCIASHCLTYTIHNTQYTIHNV